MALEQLAIICSENDVCENCPAFYPCYRFSDYLHELNPVVLLELGADPGIPIEMPDHL